MEWTECISKAISYIEDNITEELTIEDIADQACLLYTSDAADE